MQPMTRTNGTRRTRGGRTLAITLLAGTVLGTAAWAQFGGGGPSPFGTGAPNPNGTNPFGTGTPNASGPNPFGRGRLPFAMGTVSAVNSAAGTVTLTPTGGGGEGQTVKVSDATRITGMVDSSVADLKVGDTVQVRGVPTGITAAQITAGDGADAPGGPAFGPADPFGSGLPSGMGGGRGPQEASAQVTGKITHLSPLTIALAGGVSVTLKAAPDVKVSRSRSEKIGDIKAGDRLTASGTPGDDGILTATRIRVNADPGLGR